MISLVLGLGNIGQRYARTRHNVGFEVLGAVSRKMKLGPMTEHPLSYCRQAQLEDRTVTFAWPTTLMNRSGLAAIELFESLELDVSQMLVVVDDFNLPLGTLRFRERGSDGGHNGLFSISECLESGEYPRLRLGIGPLPEGADVVDFVLGEFEEEKLVQVQEMVAKAAEAVIFALTHRLQLAMSQFNSNPASPDIL